MPLEAAGSNPRRYGRCYISVADCLAAASSLPNEVSRLARLCVSLSYSLSISTSISCTDNDYGQATSHRVICLTAQPYGNDSPCEPRPVAYPLSASASTRTRSTGHPRRDLSAAIAQGGIFDSSSDYTNGLVTSCRGLAGARALTRNMKSSSVRPVASHRLVSIYPPWRPLEHLSHRPRSLHLLHHSAL